MNLIMETPRLLVREFTMDDADHFVAMQGNEAVMKYIRQVSDRETAMAFLKENIRLYRDKPRMGRWAVFEKSTGAFAGSFAIIPLPDDADKIQIGYALMPESWGKGYATELVAAGIPYFFQRHEMDILFAVTELPNTASQNVLLKSGFKEEMEFMEGQKILKRFTLSRQDFSQ